MTEKLDLVRGSGNVFADLGLPNANLEQAKAIMAAQIIKALDERELSTRQAQELTGVSHSEFSRIRRVKLDRFTIDRLMTILEKLDPETEVELRFSRRASAPAPAP